MGQRIVAACRLPAWSRPVGLAVVGLALAAAVLLGPVAGAGAQAPDGPTGGEPPSDGPADGPVRTCQEVGCLDVVAVDGLIDGILADFVIDTLAGARRADGVVGVVLQVDSPGVVVSDAELAEVAAAITGADVPVSVWVGPSGATAGGAAVELLRVADSSGIAPGSTVGPAGDQRLAVDVHGELLTGAAEVARTEVLEGQEAVDAGVVDRFTPTVLEHVVGLDGVETEVRVEDGQQRQVPVTIVRFSKLPLGLQLLHTAASPSVAFLLLVVALGLLLFEFFTAGVGVAGVVGAVSAVLAGFGLGELPVQGWALALVVLGVVGIAIDVQTGIPRAWTIIGMTAFTIGSVFLLTEFRPTWIALLVGIVGMAVVAFSGMPAMVRTRFGTPTIGREQLVDELGTAVGPVDPEGTVEVLGGLWRARTNRATPIPAGDPVRVLAIDGLVLEVEPETGGAVDYREMRRGRGSTAH